jgi:hypothetical protein
LNIESQRIEDLCRQVIDKDRITKKLEDKVKELEKNGPQVSIEDESNIFNSNNKDFFDSNKTDFLTQDRIKDLEQ